VQLYGERSAETDRIFGPAPSTVAVAKVAGSSAADQQQ